MALITLADYKQAIGETDASKDAFHQQAIDDASILIINESDRDFGVANVTEARDYYYDGKGLLSIDECTAITAVTLQGGASALPTTSWRARKEGPQTVTVFSYLELPRLEWGRSNSLGEMGFTRNLDRYLASPGGFSDIVVTVAATFGWPTVPDDVQRAVIWTAQDLELTAPTGGGGLSSKSVAEVAESYFAEQSAQSASPEPLPARAMKIIENYRRVHV